MEKGSVYPRREPATDGGSAAALPVSGGGGSLWGERDRKGVEIIEGKRMQARGNPFALSQSQI